jgi:anaerobic glycerol-3-phosphate dehydrogenase C subunit
MTKSSSKIASELTGLISGDVYGDILHRVAFSTDASIYRIVPVCVVAPRNIADIAAVVKYAGENKIPLAPRGAGTGLAGESLCHGILLNMMQYLNKPPATQDQGMTVVCEPGVALDDLNNYLARFGRKIGPDPSSSNRATAGACLANNATGAHSLQYGHFGDYVEKIETVLADGSIVEFTNDFDPLASSDAKNAEIARQCLKLLGDKQQLIKNAQPKAVRNRCGYSIAGICHQGKIDMAKLLSGSEGTLAVFNTLKLRTVPAPKEKALLQIEFDSIEKMAQSLTSVIESGVSCCELMDNILMDVVRRDLPQYRDVLPIDAAAVLLVEQTGYTIEQVKEKIDITRKAVGKLSIGYNTFLDSNKQARAWQMRKDAAPLLSRRRGKKIPTEFIEDICIDYHTFIPYVAGLQKIGKRYDITMSLFGHAGDGEMHIRPFLDLTDPEERKKMQAIAEDAFTLAWSMGGSISGEHAIGLSKAAYVRRQYGDDYYELLCGVKKILDPESLLNPGKILNSDPDIMIKNLRREFRVSTKSIKGDLLFDEEKFKEDLDLCNGCGQCIVKQTDLRMCPVYKALGEELASPRAKANLLNFLATGQLNVEDFESPDFRKLLDLCINCKACYLQCPSGVDISTLMMAARAMYVSRKSLRRTEKLLSNNRYLSIMGSSFSPISNYVTTLSPFGTVLEKTTGLDKRRTLPEFARGSFLRKAKKYLAGLPAITRPIDKVAYFTDTFVQYNDHELGRAVIDILRANNIEVIVPEQRPAPLPAIVYGDVKRARKDLSYSIRYLAQAVRDGYKIICSEPSAAMTLKEQLGQFVSGDDAKLVSENTYELMNYLLGLLKQGKLKRTAESPINKTRYVYHLPCHLSTVGNPQATITIMKELCGIEVTDLSAGCCGLAGTFGMQKKNYELSVNISAGLKNALEKNPIKNVLTECSACKMQIEQISGSTVLHPARILAEYYRH